MKQFCGQCGAQIADVASFCESCGARVPDTTDSRVATGTWLGPAILTTEAAAQVSRVERGAAALVAPRSNRSMSGGNGKVLLARGIAVAIVIGGAYVGANFYVKERVDRALEAARANPDHPFDVRYETFSLKPLAMGIALGGVTIASGPAGTKPAVRVADLTVSGCGIASGVPRRCRLSAKGVEPGELDDEWRITVAMASAVIGRTPRLDLALDYAIEPEEPHDTDVELSVGIDGLGTLALRTNGDGIDLDRLVAENSRPDPTRVRIHRASMIYVDTGFLPLVLQVAARQMNSNEAVLKEQIKQIVGFGLAATATNLSEMQAQRSAVLAFIERPSRFELSLEPKAPISLLALMSEFQTRGPQALPNWGMSLKLNGAMVPFSAR